MATYVVCEKRKGKRISEEVCRKKCQDGCNCVAFQKLNTPEPAGRAESVEKEEVEPNARKEIVDIDVLREIIERPPAIPSGGKAQQLYQQFLSLKREIGTRWFDLGWVLEQIFVGKYYIPIGYNTWQNFCLAEMGVLDISFRTVDYLRKTRVKCDEVGIEKEVAGRIGWTKIAQCLPVLTRENKDRWIEKASQKGMTTAKLNAQVRVALGKITEEESKILPEKMFFPLFKEQKEIVELALDVAGKVAASDKNGFLLADVICPSFLAEYPVGAEVGKRPEMIARLLGRFEAAFKVKFAGEVMDLETGEILVESRE